MDIVTLFIALGALIAGFSQGISGFGFGLVAMSFWAWVVDPQQAAALSVIGGFTGQIIAAFTVRRGFNLRLLLPFIVGGLCGIPIGVYLLPYLDIYKFKALLGTFLIIVCPFMLFADKIPKMTKVHHFWDIVGGLGGGVMGGFGGFTGTLPALWCTLRGFDRDTQRAIMQNFNFAMLVVVLISYSAKGIIRTEMLPTFLIVSPIVICTSYLGTKAYHRISQQRFRQLILSLLTLSGLTMLVTSVPKLL
ncbi:sulfite exporter TauE/SafE family protein [Pelistega europaea]|uniref:Probable membrane transporter protein n=1 Tax=Pelistega europaea TaxID=106147 RepID=A0A7Y4L9B3_9BURK|nr:sulfite exporter TauE/SafE family protein [Pelistega europaea]NOL49352.1 sulfite exporter TauE/SafE family protein [Pelistega europaea]